MRVVVIGGGVGGLAAAYELSKAGHEVRLFEAGPVLGGQVRTFEIGGGRIEAFYHHLFRSDRTVTALIEELGLGEDLEWVDSRVGFLSRGQIYPFVTPWDLLRFKPVSILTRLRLGLAAVWLRRVQDGGRRYEGQRARDWIVRHVGRQGYELVWGPLLRAKFGDHAPEVAMPWFWNKIYLRFASREGGPLAREQLGYLRGSFGRLVDALVEAARGNGAHIEAAQAVERVTVVDGRATGVDVGGAHIEADAVLATVPSGVFAKLVPELDASERARLERVEYQWATVLVLALDRALSDIYWLTVTDPDCPFVVAVEQTNFRSPSEYGGRHVIYLSNYADPGDPVVDEDVEQVLTRYEPFLRRINPTFSRDWILEHWLFKDRAGQPIVHHRYAETIAPHRCAIRGLYLANNTQLYPEDRGQNYTIAMGQRVAQMLLADLANPADGAADAEATPTP